MRINLLILMLCGLVATMQADETRPYQVGDNFFLTADSLAFCSATSTDTCVIKHGAKIAVAEIDTLQTEIQVKIASDQFIQGWLPEAQFLTSVVPDSPISRFIHTFSQVRNLSLLYFLVAVMAFYLYRLWKRKKGVQALLRQVASPYPKILTCAVATTATYYASLQLFAPELWQLYYFHATLNPLSVPAALSAFLILCWSLPILLIATIDEVHRFLHAEEAIAYSLGLIIVCVLLYLLFTLTIPYYIGYLCLALYYCYIWKR